MKKQKALVREDWINSARAQLLERGIQNVTIRKMATKLKVTTGAFYHIFKNLGELHRDLILDWEQKNTEPLLNAIFSAAPDGRKQLIVWDNIILFEQYYSPSYDAAIRDWARVSDSVKKAVQNNDQKRIKALENVYQNLGFDKNIAEFRAKVMYYHQIGYQTLKVDESVHERLKNSVYYAEIISNNPQKYPYNDPDGTLNILQEINEKLKIN